MSATTALQSLDALGSGTDLDDVDHVHPLLFRSARGEIFAVEHRGVVTAAMVYDHLPIIDVFRLVDAGTLLGVMDLRGLPPYVFVLTRD